MNAIEVRNLTRRFGAFLAVNDLTFDVRQGEILGFLGANGAGKSTTIRMLCGLLLPSSGSARVGDVDVGRDPEGVKQRIGYMSQRFSLYEKLTVDQNIAFFGGIYGLTGGNIFQGAMSLHQLFAFRPVPGWSDYRTPIRDLYLCGSAAHPGGGVTGACGLNAAREILRDR